MPNGIKGVALLVLALTQTSFASLDSRNPQDVLHSFSNNSRSVLCEHLADSLGNRSGSLDNWVTPEQKTNELSWFEDCVSTTTPLYFPLLYVSSQDLYLAPKVGFSVNTDPQKVLDTFNEFEGYMGDTRIMILKMMPDGSVDDKFFLRGKLTYDLRRSKKASTLSSSFFPEDLRSRRI